MSLIKKLMMLLVPSAAALTLALSAAAVFGAEILIFKDDQGNTHVIGDTNQSAEPPPPAPAAPADAPAAPGTAGPDAQLSSARIALAVEDGNRVGGSAYLFREGRGLYTPFTFSHGGEEMSAYLFIGTRYNLLMAGAAMEASKGGSLSGGYIEKAIESRRLPVAFYAVGFEPGALLLWQDGRVIKGEEGMGEPDPGLPFVMLSKNFPYEAIDFAKPLVVEVYDKDGESARFEVRLGAGG